MNRRGGLPLIYNMVSLVFPEVDACLETWRRQAALIRDDTLRTQALSSMEAKRFHCLGGSVYALYPRADLRGTVRFIVAFQTISDYLDNLCDRAGVLDGEAFRRLHLSMADAIAPDVPLHEYYALYPHRDDGGYLVALVEECRQVIGGLASYALIADKLKRLVSLYSDLQAYKHLPQNLREDALIRWATPLAARYPGISLWEFCAATGSTLGVFLLFAAAQHPGLTSEEANALFGAYFPWVCSLHILLDYFIDAGEDAREGDLNFTSYYRDNGECEKRLSFFAGQSLLRCSMLPHPAFHCTVIRGLLALYLSDSKASAGVNLPVSRSIIRRGGGRAMLYRTICKMLRARRKL